LTVKPIRSEADYEAALNLAQELMAKSDARSVDDLDVLQTLIDRWESKHHAIAMPTPAEAIRFRMEQTDMKPRELIPLLGSKSRVSEIINGQRQPTVDQIRALHKHLGIPVAVLVGEIKLEATTRRSTASKAAIEKLRTLKVMKPSEKFEAFMARATSIAPAVGVLRKSRTDRTNAKTDFGALEAWCAAVVVTAENVALPSKRKRKLGAAHARDLAKLSSHPDWPKRLPGFLLDLGIILITMDHLPGTFLDGASICRGDGAPVIALTIRHDRIDNFWFTLLHEFAHVCCHLSATTSVIFDDLDVSSSDEIEAEADEFARNALIPPDLWSRYVSPEMSIEDVQSLAARAGVHPAIVAGRWRFENGDYRRFSRMLGSGEVKKAFG
jgi:HTH-type transcriptional regulator/antitoxin HigA